MKVAELLADAELQSSKGRHAKTVTRYRSLARRPGFGHWLTHGQTTTVRLN